VSDIFVVYIIFFTLSQFKKFPTVQLSTKNMILQLTVHFGIKKYFIFSIKYKLKLIIFHMQPASFSTWKQNWATP